RGRRVIVAPHSCHLNGCQGTTLPLIPLPEFPDPAHSIMKASRFIPLLVLLFSSAGAMAQLGVYGEFTAGKSNVPLASGMNGPSWMYGPTFGVYYDPWHLPFLAAGLDARGVFLGSGNNKLDSGLFGPRLVFRPHVLPIQPYVEGLLGVGHAKYYEFGQFAQMAASYNATNFEYQFLGGLDLTVFPRIDWRVVEFSYGGLSGLGTSYNPETISTGLVVRLP
ncbi:MAG: hypothetical protein ACYDC6_14315, partial [Acidobacteriaceae bacterium]